MGRLDPDNHARPEGPSPLAYAVHSRRAGGLSIGINLSTGRECNWACRYCEVEGLTRGTPDAIDPSALEAELSAVLAEAEMGRWQTSEGPGPAPIKDISLAGDGEPTLSPSFPAAIDIAIRAHKGLKSSPAPALVVISNGSQLHVDQVAQALERWADAGGELWFKLDAGSPDDRQWMNGAPSPDAKIIAGLVRASQVCPTWIQTMVVARNGVEPSTGEASSLAGLVGQAMAEGARPAGALVYGLARPSFQPGADALGRASMASLEAVASAYRSLGLDARVFP